MEQTGLVRGLAKFRFTCVAVVVGLAICVTAHLWNVEFFEVIAAFLMRFERFEADEVVLALGLIALGLLVDLLRARRHRRHQAEILRHRQAASSAVVMSAKDVVGQFLDDFRVLIGSTAQRRISEDEFIEELGVLLGAMSSRINKLTPSDSPVAQRMTGSA